MKWTQACYILLPRILFCKNRCKQTLRAWGERATCVHNQSIDHTHPHPSSTIFLALHFNWSLSCHFTGLADRSPSIVSTMTATALLQRSTLYNPVTRCNVVPRFSINSTTHTSFKIRLPSLQLGPPAPWRTTTPLLKSRKKTEVCASLTTPLIAATDTWGTWTVLLAAGAFGLWWVLLHQFSVHGYGRNRF